MGLFEKYIELGWIETKANSREIIITPQGKFGFKDLFGLEIQI